MYEHVWYTRTFILLHILPPFFPLFFLCFFPSSVLSTSIPPHSLLISCPLLYVRLPYILFVQFFNNTSYIIGGRCYALNDIENGVLRGNKKAVAAIRRPFTSRDDPRYVLHRVHMITIANRRMRENCIHNRNWSKGG